MSTFGKKSLAWWNYHDQSRDNVRRFNFTDKDMQLQILNKWYPIGFKLYEHSFGKTWEVVGYQQNMVGWLLDLKSGDFKTQKHPLTLKPVKESEMGIKRQIKLEKILA